MNSVWVYGRYWWQCGLKRRSDWWDRGFESRWGHGYWSLVFVVCCVGSGHCDEPTTRSQESNQLCVWVIVCYIGISKMAAYARVGLLRHKKKKKVIWIIYLKFLFRSPSVYTEKTHEHESGRRWVDTDCVDIQNRRVQCKVWVYSGGLLKIQIFRDVTSCPAVYS